MSRLFALIGFVMLGSACACSQAESANPRTPAGPSSPTPPAEVHLQAGDDGRRIDLNRGQLLVVSLEGIPGTGFSWNVEEIPDRVLKPEGESEFVSNSQLVGAPAMQILRFRVIGPGQGKLTLAYRRPWEKDTPPAKVFTLDLMVR